MISHGIMAPHESILQLVQQIMQHPEIPPTPEGKECWMDRRGLKVKSGRYK